MADKPKKKIPGKKDLEQAGTKPMEKLAKRAFNTGNSVLAMRFLNQSLSATRVRGDEQSQIEAIAAAVYLLEGLKPKDSLERMLAVQMLGTHESAMECLRRASLNEQTFEGRDMNLKHAAKLMGLFERQMAALDKHRGKGQQKITVEHVTVEAGGQAIVGDVHTAGKLNAPGAPRRAAEPPALTDDSQADEIGRSIMDDLAAKKVPARKRKAG